jgi:hypothetical protein
MGQIVSPYCRSVLSDWGSNLTLLKSPLCVLRDLRAFVLQLVK